MRPLRYLSIYLEYLRTCFSEAASFRVNFVLVALVDLMFQVTTLSTVGFIFNHIENIGPWGPSEFLFFIAFVLTIDHLHMTFISESFWEFSAKVQHGTFDFVLLKPISAIFDLFFRHIRPATMPNALFVWSVLIYYGNQIDLPFWGWISLPFFLLLSLCLLVSIEILLSMTTFWTIESFGINFLRMQMQQLSRWPDFIYQFYARKFFTIALPILLIGSGPIRFLLDPQTEWMMPVYMIGAIFVLWVAIGWAWTKGLRNYESASS